MLCAECHRHVPRGTAWCASCGAAMGTPPPLQLVLADGRRIALDETITVGRAKGNTVQLEDPSVSRRHARITADAAGRLTVADEGSSHGTWLDGRRIIAPQPLRDGARLRIGDAELLVEAPRDERAAARTIVVPDTGDLRAGAGSGVA